MNVWDFQRELTRRLGSWAGMSILSGILLNLLRDPLWRAVGMQFAGWGLINAAIAFFGQRSQRQKLAGLADPLEPETQRAEAAGLERMLWINGGLDVLYVLGGVLLALSRGRRERQAAGHGWGIAAQGIFLFFFDLIHALALRHRNEY